MTSADGAEGGAADVLLVDRPAHGVVRFRLNRPARRNAIDLALIDALLAAFDGRHEDVVVLGGVGPVFCAGADLKIADAERAEVSDRLYTLYDRMVSAPMPVIAALAGAGVGAGAQLAVAADLRVAAPGAHLRFPGAGHGLAVGAWALPALVGRGRAMDLCLTMRPVDAQEAHAIGLVDRIAADADAAAVALAVEVAGLDRGAATRVKRVVTTAAAHEGALIAEAGGNRSSWSGATATRGTAR